MIDVTVLHLQQRELRENSATSIGRVIVRSNKEELCAFPQRKHTRLYVAPF